MEYSLLAKLPLFRSLGEEELSRIFAQLNITKSWFRKGEILALQDAPCNRLILLLRGSVKGEMTDPTGRIMKVEDIEAPSPLAILFLFGQEARFPVQVTAREEVEALVIPRPAVLKMLSMNETLLSNYLNISADFASRLSQKLHFMSFRTIRQKLAVYLLERAQNHPSGEITLDRSKAALAEYFGVTRPSLEREITRMQTEGMIRAERRAITLTNLPELKRCISS